MTAPATLAADIEAAIAKRDGRKEGAEVRFHCPNPDHTDTHPSARWNPDKATWYCDSCGAGGGAVDLARRLGLDLPEREKTGLTLAELAAAKRLPVNLLASVGVTDGKIGRNSQTCLDIPYLLPDGRVAAVRKRLSLTTEPRFAWRKGDHPIPYGLPKLREAKAAGYVILVEGESDSWTVWAAGLPALGIPGASTWRREWPSYLEGIATAYVWREPDTGGDTLAAKVAATLPDVRIIDAPPGVKDASQLWLSLDADADAFRRRMAELMAAARPASELRAEALSAEARECYRAAAGLLEDPNLIERIGEAIRLGGFAGDLTPAFLAYLALASRLLERPMNLAFVGASASGKSHAVDAALALMPPTAFVLEKAGSARALIYGEGDFEHKTVVVAEADSIPSEGSAASALRCLAADNCMTYDTVERDEQTGRFTTRHIEKPGPTGLITTSTRTLSAEFDTRLLTVSVADTPSQTEAVLTAHAASVNGSRPSIDTGALIALQRWLELAGERRVAVPFGYALAKAVPHDQIRMRRDFRQLLTSIQAIALLYQLQRERDADGRIVATLEDYDVARRLLWETFQTVATGGVSATVRETVEAVNRLYDGATPLTVKAIGDALGLAKNTTSYRVRRALKVGCLVNLETRKGAPAKITPGESLPEYRPALPDIDVIMPLYLPETVCTIEPPPSARIYAESEGAVQTPLCTAIEPLLNPGDGSTTVQRGSTGQLNRSEADFESENGPKEATVQWFNADRGGQDTYTQSEPAEVRCPICGSTEWWYRADGSGPVCGVCHPNPAVLVGDRL